MRFILLAAAALLATAPAAAGVYTLTLSGNLETNPDYNIDQTDRLGLFGPVGQLMAGQAFVARWRIDTQAGWRITPPDPGSTTTVITSGRSIYGNLGDAIIGSFTMAGRTIGGIGQPLNPFANPTGFYSQSQMALLNSPFYDQISISASTVPYSAANTLTVNGRQLIGGNMAMGATIASSGAPNLFTPGVYFDSFDISRLAGTLIGSNGSFSVAGDGMRTSFYYFSTSSASLASAAVPEPASWAMMIAGFGFTGALARRRWRKLRVVAA